MKEVRLLTRQPFSPYDLAVAAANAAESKKAEDTTVLDTGRVSSLSDYFIITSGSTPVQVKAIAEAIKDEMKKLGARALHEDRGQRWTLLDYGDIVIHVLHSQERQFYKLEDFWNHALPLPREKWLREERAAS
jgi:ribosome-associated protein